MSKGWECPKCGACYAIWVDECRHCVPKPTIHTSGTVTGRICGVCSKPLTKGITHICGGTCGN